MADMNAVMVEAAAASPPLTDCIEANRECEFEAELSCDIGASVSTGRVRWTKLDGRDSYYSMGVRSGYGDVISSFGCGKEKLLIYILMLLSLSFSVVGLDWRTMEIRCSYVT